MLSVHQVNKFQGNILQKLFDKRDIVFTANWEMITAVDISDPSTPLLIASEKTPVRAMGIAAAGNEGTSNPIYPAASENMAVIAVGATDSNDAKASFCVAVRSPAPDPNGSSMLICPVGDDES